MVVAVAARALADRQLVLEDPGEVARRDAERPLAPEPGRHQRVDRRTCSDDVAPTSHRDEATAVVADCSWTRRPRSVGADGDVRRGARRHLARRVARRGPRRAPGRPWPSRAGSRRHGQPAAQRAAGERRGGAAATARASVGSMAPASSSSRSSSSRSRSAVRERATATTSRPAIVVEQREQLVAHPVAHEPAVGVGRVDRPGRARGRRTSAAVSARRSARSGWRVPGRIAGEPVAPAPRSRLISTVSAWSSAVWPVSGAGGERRVRAARARASRLGPAATSTRMPQERARRARRRARPARVGLVADRRPQAVVDVDGRRRRQPGGARRARTSAVESAPPENAQRDRRAGGRERAAGEQVVDVTSARRPRGVGQSRRAACGSGSAGAVTFFR